MEYRPLHITLISAQGIKDVKLFSKMDVYAEVSIAGYPLSKKTTPVHKNCGTNPRWNFQMDFIVDEAYLTKPGMSLIFHLIAKSTLRSDKLIGTTAVPIQELFHDQTGKTIQYPVHTSSGRPMGSLTFSYRFGDKFQQQPPPPPPVNHYPVTAYPAAAPGHGGYGYGYQQAPPPPAGYGYGYPPAGYGYGYPPAGQKPKKSRMGGGGMGMGMGLGTGLLGGFLLGEMVSDVGDAAAYADGYDDAMDDMGGDF